MKKQHDEGILENLYYHQLHQSEQLNPLLSLYIQDIVRKSESRDYTRLKNIWWSDTWNSKLVRGASFFKTQLDKTACGGTAAKSTFKGKGKRTSGYYVQWRVEGQCSQGDKCGVKREEARIQRKWKGFETVQISKTEFLRKRTSRQEKVFLEKNTSQHASLYCWVVVQKETPVIGGIHLGVLFHQEKICNLGSKVCVAEKAGRRTKEMKLFCRSGQNIGSHPNRGGHYFANIHSEGRLSARGVSDSSEINFTEHRRE